MVLERLFKITLCSPDGETRYIVNGLNGNPGIVAGSLQLQEILCDEEVSIGQCCANRLEVELYNFTHDVTGYWILLENTFDTSGRNSEPWFKGVIDTSEGASKFRNRRIVAYDLMYYVRNYPVLDWLINYFESAPSMVTLERFRNDLCAYVGFDIDRQIPNLLGDDTTFSDNPTGQYQLHTPPEIMPESLTFGRLLHDICQLQCSVPNVGRDGRITFVPMGMNASTAITDITDNYEQNNTDINDNSVIPFKDLTLLQLVDNDNDGEYTSKDNILLGPSSVVHALALLRDVVSTMQSIQYTPANINLIVSDYSIKPGAIVQIHDALCDDTVCKITRHLILSQTFSGPLLVDQELVSSASGDIYNKPERYELIPDPIPL